MVSSAVNAEVHPAGGSAAPRPLRVGVLQLEPAWGDEAANRGQVEALLASAPAFDVMVLPELCLSGYQFRSRTELAAHAVEVPGPQSEWLGALAARHSAVLVAGLAERAGLRLHNSAIAAGPEGLLATYRKVHLFHRETQVFDPGDLGFPVTEVGVNGLRFRLGIMICFDWLFPEAARTLALRGAQLIAHPSNLVLPFCQDAMVTRCLENRVHAATANRVGTEDRWEDEQRQALTFTGRSQVVDARGRRRASLETAGTGVVVVELDLAAADDKRPTPWNHLWSDRRPEAYVLEEP